ncbi:MAG TPA: neutral zinc metallopeptidase [Kribbella sp.]
MDRTRGRKLIAGGCALLAFGIVATVAISWDRGNVGAAAKVDPGVALASEAARARAEVPTAVPTPTGEPTEVPSAPPQPAVVTRNRLYQVGRLPASRCAEPVREPTSPANVRAYYTEFVACLNKAWAPAIRKAGFTFVPPRLVVTVGQSASSPCDGADGEDYYCHGAIYIDARNDLEAYKHDDPGLVMMYMAFVIAHEYGHHVQALTGILAVRYQRRATINGLEATLEESRRLELQASCLGAVYFGADKDWFPVDDLWIADFESLVSNVNDPERDHGKAESHRHWSMAGLDSASPASCNTYTADSPQVS